MVSKGGAKFTTHRDGRAAEFQAAELRRRIAKRYLKEPGGDRRPGQEVSRAFIEP